QIVLRPPRRRRKGGVEPEHLGGDGGLIDVRDAGQKYRFQIVARRRGRLDAEKRIQQGRQRRVGEVIDKLTVVLRFGGVELIFIGEADQNSVHQRISKARDLGPGPSFFRGG